MSAQVQSRVRGRRRRRPKAVAARGDSDAGETISPLDRVSDGVILLDPRGRITFVNKAAERLMGCDRADCVGRPLGEAMPDLAGRAVKARCRQAARSGDETTFEIALVGTRRPIQVRASPGSRGDPAGALTLCLTDLTVQRAAEAALRQSEARFRAIVEHAPIGIEQVALADGGLLEVNAHLCRMLATPREELLQTNFASITHPDDLRRERKVLRQLIAGQISSYSIEKRYRHRDGEWIWVRVTSALCHVAAPGKAAAGARPFRISIVEDISEARELAQERTRMAAIVESSDDAILSEDLDGIIQTWNPGAERMFGYTAEEIVGRSITTLMPPERAHEEGPFLARIRRGLRVHHYETIRRHKDGRLVEVSLSLSPVRDATGRIVAAAKIARDVTEHHSQQRALRDSEARTRAVIEAAADGIVVIDKEGHIESANPATERLFGYRADELLGRNIRTLMPEPYHSEHDRYLAEYLRTGRAHIIGAGREVIGLRKDGGTFPMSLAVSELRLGDRRMFTGIVHDLTGRRQLEQEVLHASTDEQRRIGQDLHDGLCQELVSLSMGAELLAKRLDAASPHEAAAVRRLSDDVQSAAEQARRLSHGLNPVDVEAGGLAGALEHLAHRVTESTTLTCRLTHHPLVGPQVLAALTDDVTTNLYRIAQEAVGNAVKHARASRIEIRLRSVGRALTLEVSDNGRGMAQDVSAPSAPRRSGGEPGIGLRTMTYRARMIGGDLTIARRRGGGTVITCSVRLPGA